VLAGSLALALIHKQKGSPTMIEDVLAGSPAVPEHSIKYRHN